MWGCCPTDSAAAGPPLTAARCPQPSAGSIGATDNSRGSMAGGAEAPGRLSAGRGSLPLFIHTIPEVDESLLLSLSPGSSGLSTPMSLSPVASGLDTPMSLSPRPAGLDTPASLSGPPSVLDSLDGSLSGFTDLLHQAGQASKAAAAAGGTSAPGTHARAQNMHVLHSWCPAVMRLLAEGASMWQGSSAAPAPSCAIPAAL